MQKAREMATRLTDFLKTGIWQFRLSDLPPLKSVLVRILRTFILSVRGFTKDQCALRASALTFYTLLSIVPVAAMAFGIAKGFGFERMLEKELYSQFAGQQEVVSKVIEFAQSLLENTQGGLIAGIGLVVLFWSVIKVLSQIEISLNGIWGVEKQRSFGRKFSDYLSVMLISPLLIILSNSATVFITTQITQITQKVAFLSVFNQLILFSFKLIPYVLIWILFTVLYILMPNTKVRFGPGLFAGIVAGTVFQLVQWGYIAFQIGAAKYNAIYGSFAALPLFLIWLQLSWMIVLFGAEIAYSAQNADNHEFEPDIRKISPSYNLLITLEICRLLVKEFANGGDPMSAAMLSERLGLPIGLVNRIMGDLVDSRLVSIVNGNEGKEPSFQPARDIHTLSISSVVGSLEHRGVDSLPLADPGKLKALTAAMKAFDAHAANSPANRLLKDI